MKIILFAAALTLGGAALAQSGATVDHPSQRSGEPGITQQGTDPEGQPCTPPGYNASVGAYPPCPVPPTTPTRPPRCTRDITDGCIQDYERGVRR